MPDHRTRQILDELKTYTASAGNEPPSFTFNRLTADLFATTFAGGGAFVNPAGDGLTSEDSKASMLDGAGGAPTEFPIEVSIDLTTAELSGKWTLPDGTAQTPAFEIHCLGAINGPDGRELFFHSDGEADAAAYSLVVLLS